METKNEKLKVLALDIYFKLPDDFKGNFTDALFEYASYRLNKKTESQVGEWSDEYEDGDNWETFLSTIAETDYKVTGNFSVMEYDFKTEKWKDIDCDMSNEEYSADLDKLHLKLMSEVKSVSENNIKLREELQKTKLELEKALDMITRDII